MKELPPSQDYESKPPTIGEAIPFAGVFFMGEGRKGDESNISDESDRRC